MELRRLLAPLPDAVVSGSLDLDITDIVYDSRSVRPGSLFVALPSVSGGAEGYRFAGVAVERGARAILTEAAVEVEGVTVVRVPNAREAMADVAAEFFGRPSDHLTVFAVTGTDGKTTTTYLLEQILEAAGYRSGLIGTVEIKIGERRERNLERMTTPEAPDVQRLLREMVDAGVTHLAMEASSHALALGRLRNVHPAVCGLTNITADHIEFHGSPEAYFEAKASLFTQLAPGKPAILNRDDSSYERLAPRISGPIRTYGRFDGADVYARDTQTDADGSTFEMVAGSESVKCRVPLPGDFNVLNALAAAACAMEIGVELPTICEALGSAAPPPGRMQRVDGGDVRVIVDYAHTMHAFRSVLASLRAQVSAPNRLIAVFGATGDRDRAKRPVLGRIASDLTDFFIVTNEDPYREDPGAIMDEVLSGVDAGDEQIRFVREPDRGEAIRRAVIMARPGDTVAILGKGHEQSMVVHGRKEPFSDLDTARRALESRS